MARRSAGRCGRDRRRAAPSSGGCERESAACPAPDLTRNGPLPIGLPVLGLSIPFLQIRRRSSPASACEGRTLPKSPRHSANRERRTTRTVFLPERSNRAHLEVEVRRVRRKQTRIAWWVKTKSAAVTGTPSLQRASERMWYVSVNGGVRVYSTCETSCSLNVKSSASANAPGSTSSQIQNAVNPCACIDDDREARRLRDRPEHDAPRRVAAPARGSRRLHTAERGVRRLSPLPVP